MTLTSFVRKNAFRNKRRSILTVLSIGFSLLLLTFLITVWRSFYDSKPSEQSAQRLIVRHKVSLVFNLPSYYRQKIQSLPHVKQVVNQQWFGGQYKDDKPDNFFAQMDRAGILVNAGYQCCDAWQLPYNGKGVTRADYRVLRLSALTLGQRLRNHPSVDSFQWSVNPPIPKQEKVSLAAFRQADFGDPLISSAEYNSSPVLGPSGEKEGPYDWVPPSYWYSRRYLPGNGRQSCRERHKCHSHTDCRFSP